MSDSKSVLHAPQSKGWANALILLLLEHHHLLSTILAKTICFYWIPSHVGIKGNDFAEQAAKDTINDDASSVPCTDRRRHIHVSTVIPSKWQSLWDEALNSKLHAIHSSLGPWPGSRRNAHMKSFLP